MKLVQLLLFLSLLLPVYGLTKTIRVTGPSEASYDLRGEDGNPGARGQDGYELLCRGLSDTRQGRDGQDGRDGEDGRPGEDIYIIYDQLSDLANIKLNQQGGQGGPGGPGGKGSKGCNGSLAGTNGVSGRRGAPGAKGRVFLIHREDQYEKDNTTEVVSVSSLKNSPLILSENIWIPEGNAKGLFHPDSIISNKYYTYSKRKEYRVSLLGHANLNFDQLDRIKLALILKNGKLLLNSINGPILDYGIHYLNNQIIIEIKNFISESILGNLRLGKIRSQNEQLYLEVKEKYPFGNKYQTSFVVSLFYLDPQTKKEKSIGYFQVTEKDWAKEDKKYKLFLGRLNFSDFYKQKGTKLRIHVSVYRMYQGQTRIISLRGIFKI